MNLGATHASGDVLLFLHGDCTLESGALTAALRCLRSRHVAAGCFQMRIGADGWAYRSIDFCATARVRLTGVIYGDQGLFLTRERFERAGQFPELRLMEDVFLSLTLRRTGRMVVAPRRIYVAPRRWLKQGVVRKTLRNWTLTALAAAGVPPDRLAAYYPAVRLTSPYFDFLLTFLTFFFPFRLRRVMASSKIISVTISFACPTSVLES